MILIDNFLEKGNLDKNGGSLVVNNLLFYIKKKNYCANAFELMNLSLIVIKSFFPSQHLPAQC